MRCVCCGSEMKPIKQKSVKEMIDNAGWRRSHVCGDQIAKDNYKYYNIEKIYKTWVCEYCGHMMDGIRNFESTIRILGN